MTRTNYDAPLLRDEGILSKPKSDRELVLEDALKGAMDALDANEFQEEIKLDLHKFYAAFLTKTMPGIDEDSKLMVYRSLRSFQLVIKQPMRKPRQGYLQQLLFPCPFKRVSSSHPKCTAYLVPLKEQDKIFIHRDREVTNRLALRMEFDLLADPRPQILLFGKEAEMACEQYCVYKDQGDTNEL